MDIKSYISEQSPERQHLMSAIHQIIVETDKSVTAAVEKMMGKEMIIYKSRGMMKYGLSSVKNYMSLHILPIYGSTALHSKYKVLLSRANFQKGCINFDNEEQMPTDIVRQLISDCSTIDLAKIREEYLKQKKNRT